MVFNTCLNTILAQVDQLRDLVNEFASFAKLPDANLKDGSINALLKEVLTFSALVIVK